MASTLSFTGCVNKRGDNLAHYLCRKGRVTDLMMLQSIINDSNRYLLLEYSRTKQCVHIAANEDKANAIEKLQLLSLWGADLNGKEKKRGNTPLHIAVYSKNYKLAEWLCKQPQVSKEALNYNHQTPYYVAYERGDQKMMNILLDNGAQCTVSHSSKSDSSYEEL